MIRVLFIFLLLFAAVWLGVQLNHDPGYLLISINQWTLETTLWVAIFALCVFFFFMYILITVLKWIVYIPSSWRKGRRKRRFQKGQAKTRQGIIEFSEGHWQEARANLITALPNSDTPLLNYLTAARAAQEMGDNELRDGYLREAQQSIPDAQIAVELTQAQLQLDNRQWEQARLTLKHLRKLTPRHPYVLRLLKRLYEEIHEWQQLILLLPELQKSQVMSTQGSPDYPQYVYLKATQVLLYENSPQKIDEWINKLPKKFRLNPEIMAEYSRYLLATGEYRQAEGLIRRCLNKEYNEKLVELYGKIKSDDAKLSFAESLLKNNPHSAALILCLARLSIAQNLWGKARIYLDESIRYAPTPDAFMELGGMLEKLNDHPSACEAYRQGLALAKEHQI